MMGQRNRGPHDCGGQKQGVGKDEPDRHAGDAHECAITTGLAAGVSPPPKQLPRRQTVSPRNCAHRRSISIALGDDLRARASRRGAADFFTAELLTLRGLVTYYVLFFIHLESRRVDIAGITTHPNEPWMKQIARNVTMEGYGILRDCRYLLHDRDTKYTRSFRAIIASGQVEPLALPAHSPNLNAYAERWVRSVKEEILCRCGGRVIPVRCNPTTKA